MRSLKSAKTVTPDWLTAAPIAHRGLHNKTLGAEENSMTAFLRAKSAGLPIEFDMHLSADFKPVIFHDENLARMTGDSRQIADVTASELMVMPLGDSTDYIPDLQSVLQAVDGHVPLVIELKPSPFGREKLAEIVWSMLKTYKGAYSIQSFDPFLLHWFRKNAPQVIRGQLAMKSPPRKMPAYKKFLMHHMLLNTLSKPHYIGYDVASISDWTVKRAVKKSMKLLAWTVCDEKQLEHARLHADNIIFENLPVETVA